MPVWSVDNPTDKAMLNNSRICYQLCMVFLQSVFPTSISIASSLLSLILFLSSVYLFLLFIITIIEVSSNLLLALILYFSYIIIRNSEIIIFNFYGCSHPVSLLLLLLLLLLHKKLTIAVGKNLKILKRRYGSPTSRQRLRLIWFCTDFSLVRTEMYRPSKHLKYSPVFVVQSKNSISKQAVG